MKINHLLNSINLYQGVSFDVFPPQSTISIFKEPPHVTREELLIREAISDECLHDYEKGYEHLPEIDDEEVREAEARLQEHGDDWWDGPEEAWEAHRDLQQLIRKKSAQQFVEKIAPSLPPEIARRRLRLITDIEALLEKCRACERWDTSDEDRLAERYLENTPEDMIPYTSIPRLLRFRAKISELLELHQKPLDEISILARRLFQARTEGEVTALQERIEQLRVAARDNRQNEVEA